MSSARKALGVLCAVALVAAILLSLTPRTAADAEHSHADDPGHNIALPCEAVGSPGLVPRSALNITHVTNVCGFVGTDIEFQSRKDAQGNIRDYAFVGTMGAGTRIFDITDPAHPFLAGGYFDPGWQNEVAVRGDLLVLGFDPVVVGINVSTCLREKSAAENRPRAAGVDVVRLHYDPQTGLFTTERRGCYLSQSDRAGAHTTTIHPSGDWLTMNTARAGVEVVDLREWEPKAGQILPAELVGTAHDLSFSRDGNTMYVASPSSADNNPGGTYIIDVSNLPEKALPIAYIPEITEPDGYNNPRNMTTGHQADVSSDGRILVFTDERGGGLSETSCNTTTDGIIGGMHFWAVAPIKGRLETANASPAKPVRLGSWFYPNPLLAVDALDPVLARLGRTERSCTIHVFRNGGNGSAGPGEIQAGYDGVSSLPANETVSAHYGAGVWHISFAGPSSSVDDVAEEPNTDWGNTLGWNVMPGADTWSAKEYKGYIYTGDMARGFDVYRLTKCVDLKCISSPTSTAGAAWGGGRTSNELAELSILRGTSAGGKANFSFSVSYTAGEPVPSGSLSFTDHATKKKIQATSFDSFTASGTKATFSGLATVNDVPGVRFFGEVEDLGEPGGADSFRIVLADGYGAGGVLLKGNIEVESRALLQP